MANQKITFIADDGKEFTDEGAADAHNASLKHSAKVEEYIAAAGLEKAGAGLARKHLPAFALFLETGTLPTPAEKKEKKTPPAQAPAPAPAPAPASAGEAQKLED